MSIRFPLLLFYVCSLPSRLPHGRGHYSLAGLLKYVGQAVIKRNTDSFGGLVSAAVNPTTGCPNVSVVIPARNEARNIVPLLSAMPASVDEIVLVDGGSVDGTVEAARKARPDIVVAQQGRRGKGNALAAGFELARGRYVVMIDADWSMDPAEIDAFVAALDAGADYAKGTRFAPGGGSDDITSLRRAGNAVLNGLTNLLFGTRYSDLCYGYNAFRRECVQVFALEPAQAGGAARWGDGFEIETIINTRVAKAGVAITEVPSFERPRLHGESNLRTFRDGGRVLAAILRERFTRRRPSLPAVGAMPAPVGLAARIPGQHSVDKAMDAAMEGTAS